MARVSKATGLEVVVNVRGTERLKLWVPWGPGYTATTSAEAWRAAEKRVEKALADDQ